MNYEEFNLTRMTSLVASKQIRDSSPKAVLNDPEFFLILRESIVSAWKKVIGESAQSIFHFLELVSDVQKPEEFHKKLYSIFGQGSLSLEKIIVLELFQRLNVPFKDSKGASYAESVSAACRVFLTRKSVIDR